LKSQKEVEYKLASVHSQIKEYASAVQELTTNLLGHESKLHSIDGLSMLVQKFVNQREILEWVLDMDNKEKKVLARGTRIYKKKKEKR
jgi:hypothetical protein